MIIIFHHTRYDVQQVLVSPQACSTMSKLENYLNDVRHEYPFEGLDSAVNFSRSGRVLKKTFKVKEMEDFDINEIDTQGKSRKKGKSVEEFEEYDNKRVAPIKIPKIYSMQGTKKKTGEGTSSAVKQVYKPSFQGSMKGKPNLARQIYNDSSDGSDSSSVSSETSSSSTPTSTDASDDDDLYNNVAFGNNRKITFGSGFQPIHEERVIVEPVPKRVPQSVYMDQSSDMSSDDSEDAPSDSALVIAEESDESLSYKSRGQKGNVKKRVITKKDPTYAPRAGRGRKRPAARNTGAAAKKRKTGATAASASATAATATATTTAPKKAKPLTAYMLWCRENRKKIAAAHGNIGFSNIGKKMGETWQALPEKEKLAWKRKAKRLAQKSNNAVSPIITKTTYSKTVSKASSNTADDHIKGSTENAVLGTAPIDVAAHLKLLGDSLTVIGQRLIEHEGQLAVSGIYSVLLDTLLCSMGPLLCLTTDLTGLHHLHQTVYKRTLDHIAYFMPGL